jgi:hypothetical protein
MLKYDLDEEIEVDGKCHTERNFTFSLIHQHVRREDESIIATRRWVSEKS